MSASILPRGVERPGEFFCGEGDNTERPVDYLLALIHGPFSNNMAILVCPWSWRKPATWTRVYCPQDGTALARNGQFGRTVWDRDGAHPVVIQRFRCARCRRTYSALPWDLQPHRSVSRPVLWAVWGWRIRRQWAWRRVWAWCLARFPITARTLQRWRATVTGWLARLGPRLLQTLAARGAPPPTVWAAVDGDPWATWRRLWRGWGRATAGAARTGSWLAISAVAGWLPPHRS